tara:strand:- start:3659 stop:4513 length:855 start_codon:yes stop_codon:yes gene_type:complete
MNNYNLGIIGRGFVGSAVEYAFSPQTQCDFVKIRVYDIDPLKSSSTLDDTVNKSDIIFVSVPTPSNNDGTINLNNVDDVLMNIDKVITSDPIILLRSTMLPGTTSKLQKKYPKLRLVFNPEFLTERSAKFDFLNQSRAILGGEKENVTVAKRLYRKRFGKSLYIIETDFETAELIKYMCNCFFATKVSFMNEMKLIADKTKVDWDTAIEGFVSDGRVGKSHLDVPGPDGKRGYGGSCFPKDIQALIKFSESHNLINDTIKGSWESNLKIRSEKDWEKLKGRSII